MNGGIGWSFTNLGSAVLFKEIQLFTRQLTWLRKEIKVGTQHLAGGPLGFCWVFIFFHQADKRLAR